MVQASEVDDPVRLEGGQDIKEPGTVEEVGAHAGKITSMKKGERFSHKSCHSKSVLVTKETDHL
jgi:hypothetical protein